MYTTNDAVIVGTSELRDQGGKALKELGNKKIILTQKGNPVGVIESFVEHEEKEKKIDLLEDIILGFLAKERMAKKAKWLSAEEMQKLIFS